MTRIDKLVAAINPVLGVKRQLARSILAATSHTGANTTKNSMRRWDPTAGDSDADDLEELSTLRPRARDLYRNNSHGRGALRTPLTNSVGTGLKLKPRIDADKLGLNDEQKEDWELNTDRVWRQWSESVDCDAARKLDFCSLQRLVFLSRFMSGDCFSLQPEIDRGNDIDLAVQILEADQCSTPFEFAGDEDVKDGVRVGKWGEPISYYFSESHPGSTDYSMQYEWKEVQAFGKKTKRKNVLHLMDMDRPGQKRGIPFLAPVIEDLKQMGRYKDSELMASVVSSMFTAFITTEGGDNLQEDSVVGEADKAPDISLGSGAVVPLAEGEKVELANPMRPNPQFGDFMLSSMRGIGSALDIPVELLTKQFNNSFSATKGAFLEAWKFFKTERNWLAKYFCQPTYENFLYEAIAKGFISAPGYFSDNSIRKAYSGSVWVGPAQGMIEEVKGVQAAALRVQNNFSTSDDEATAMTGTDFMVNVAQRKKEVTALKNAGLPTEMVTSTRELDQKKQDGEDQVD